MNNKTRHEIISELNKIIGYSELTKRANSECGSWLKKIINSAYHIDALMVKVERRRSRDKLTSYPKNKIIDIANILIGKNVMVVDGTVEIQDMLKNMFSLFECNVKCVSSGIDALQMFDSYKPDIVCIDIIVPGINGDEVVRSLKEIDGHTKYIAITALKEYSLEQASVFDAYLAKPFLIDQLLSSIIQCYNGSLESKNNSDVNHMDFSDLSQREKEEIIKSAKNGEISELELIVDSLADTKSKEWLEEQVSKMNLNIILMNLK